jgi:two-component system chemotaxis sensor kinase CheA
LVYLNRELWPDREGNPREKAPADPEVINIVVLQAGDRHFGLVVDAITGTEEIVVKPLSKQLKGSSVFAGATIRGDGKVALILDVLGLAQKANVISGVRERARTEKPTSVHGPAADRQTLLLFRAQDGTRMAIPLSLVARLEEFRRSALERVGPQEVVQYRDEILPLIDISRRLGQRDRKAQGSRLRKGRRRHDSSAARQRDPVQVIVYAGKGQRVGLVVDRILDIVEETLDSRATASSPGVLYTAVIQGRVTQFLDVEGMLRSTEPEFLEGPQTVGVKA